MKRNQGLWLFVVILIVIGLIFLDKNKNNKPLVHEVQIEISDSVLSLYYAEHHIMKKSLALFEFIHGFENSDDAFKFLNGYARANEIGPLIRTFDEPYEKILMESIAEELAIELYELVTEISQFTLTLNYVYIERNSPLNVEEWEVLKENFEQLLDDIYFKKDELTLYILAAEPKEAANQYSSSQIEELIQNIYDRKKEIEDLIYKKEYTP